MYYNFTRKDLLKLYEGSRNCLDIPWRILGPGGGGAQYIPTVSPFDPDIVFVACDMTGAYITRNGGKSWREINFGTWAGAFAFDPVNPGVIYAGATGLYHSVDNGENWSLVFPHADKVINEMAVGDHAERVLITDGPWPGGKVKAVAIDPEDAECMLVGVNPGNSHAEGVNAGTVAIFCSTDRGTVWRRVLEVHCGKESTSFVKIFIDPSSPKNCRKVYIFTNTGIFQTTMDSFSLKEKDITPVTALSTILDAAWGMDRFSGLPVFYILCPLKGDSKALSAVYKSIDGCNTWKRLKAGLESDQYPGQLRRFTRLAACAADAEILYLACCEPTEDNANSSSMPYCFGILKSENGGELWKWALKISENNPVNKKPGWVEKDYATDWGGAPFNFGVSPVNPQVCYATDWGTTYRTTDGGGCWEQLYCLLQPDGSYTSRGLDVTNVYGIHFDPFDKEHVAISCTDIGLLESVNSGSSWKHSQEGVPARWINTCYWLIFDPVIKGKAWSVWSGCHDLPRPKMLRNGKLHTYQGGVCKSVDGLKTWESSNRGIPDNCAATHIILDPLSPAGKRTLYAAGFGTGVFKSVDDGESWIVKNRGIEGNLNAWKLLLLPDGIIYLLVARGLDGGKTVDGALYRSSDGAEHWQKVPIPSAVNFPNDLCFDPQNPGRLYLACWPETREGEEKGGGLYVTENGGESWQELLDESIHVYGIAVDYVKTSIIYAATFEGVVLRSDDRGESWGRLGGYDFKWAKTPFIDPCNEGMLYITTFGSSVWYGPAQGNTILLI